MNALAGVLWPIFVVLLAIWLISFLLEATAGGLIHLLLAFAVVAGVVAIVRSLTGRKT